MKTITSFLIAVILFNIWSCSKGQTDSNETKKIPKLSINEIMNHYDSKLSVKQRSYRLWIEAEDRMMAGVFEPRSIEKLSNVNDNINHFMSAIDTIRSYMLFFHNMTAEYGSELIIRMKDKDVKEKFNVKWRAYQEGVTEVMNYDLETTNHLLEALIFLKDNHEKYTVENDLTYFVDDISLKEYQRLLGVFADPKIQVSQQSVRSNSIHDFFEAISIAKEQID